MRDFRSAIPMTPGYMPQNAAVDSAFVPAQATIHPALANGPLQGHIQPFRMHMSNHPPDDGFARYGQNQSMVHSAHRGIETLSLGSGGSDLGKATIGGPSQPHFKERALAQAHKTYADLLTWIGHSKKLNAKLGSGPRPSTKMVVYPRPPSQPISNVGQTKPRLTHAATTPVVTTYVQHMALKQANAARAFTFSGQQADHAGGHAPVMAQVVPRPGLHRSPYSTGHPRMMYDMSSPLLMAKTSLDMLTGLCENSDWKWVDGMLLGGCLHYGLEHYEEALDWFRRIINLDNT